MLSMAFLPARRFWAPLAWLTVLVATVVIALWPSFASIVAIWLDSRTFVHGLLVVPIVGYLIWLKRAALAACHPRADARALLAIWLLGATWLLGWATQVLVVEQLSAALLLVAASWLALGLPTLRVIAFPLGFLVLFGVPLGSELIYPMMQLTAIMTVTMLRWSGIPVYSDGTFFSIPSGNWSVVAACSGVRYLIASVFLGTLYAYFVYRALWRRLLFIALSILVPVFANGVRAYFLVMIGHLSDMKLGIGPDHFVFGWVSFGVFMFLLFYIGRFWVDPEPELAPTAARPSAGGVPPPTELPQERRNWQWPLLGVLSIALWPAWQAHLARVVHADPQPALELPEVIASWRTTDTPLTDWQPHYLGTAATARRDYQREGAPEEQVGVYVGLYTGQSGEAVTGENVLIPEDHPRWRMPTQRHLPAAATGQHPVVEARLQSAQQELLVWRWYWVNGWLTASDYRAKFYHLLGILSGRPHREAVVILYTPLGVRLEPARTRLRDFLPQLLPELITRLETAARITSQ